MLSTLRGVSVYAHSEPCDMRKSFNTLAVLVEGALKRDISTGGLFVFVSKSRKQVEVLYFDGTGLCLFCKRLETGKFAAPWQGPMSKKLELTMNELSLFIEGSETLGRVPLSPPLLRKADLRRKFSEQNVS